MATATLNDCTQLDATLLERVNYFPRQLLTADDLVADQEYFIAKLRRHNRYLHGWGVVCGLNISVAPTAQSPWQIQIGAGYALGPYGDEIYVPNPVLLDLAQCGPGASTDPCDPGSLLQSGLSKTGIVLYIAIRYEECLSRPVRVLPGGCGCSDSGCEPSRITDSYEIQCLADLPPSSVVAQGPSMCDIINGRALPQCPPCPTDPWVVLAQVQLPANTATPLVQSAIDNVTVRPIVFSTAVIQEQVRRCCCAAADKAPVRVTSITPAAGTVFTDAATIPPVLVVTFDKHLVASSVNTNTILVLRTTPGVPSKQLQGTVTYDDGTRTAQFKPAEAFTIPGTYLVTVVGSGPNQITDSDNLALDGNDDGVPGGNFISQFTVATTAPTPTPTPTPTATPTPTPTQAPSPLTGDLRGPDPVPIIRSPNTTAVGDLLLSIKGGTAGQKIQANVVITLSQNLANTPATDTAHWDDSAGNSATAVKGANTYTFSNIMIVQPGPGAAFEVKLTNMKVDATRMIRAQQAGLITAFVAISAPVTTSITNPTQSVAQVIPG